MSSSEVKVAEDNLTWRKANDACRLISFSQVKSENELFVNQMGINSNYWIKDLVEEFSVVMKGIIFRSLAHWRIFQRIKCLRKLKSNFMILHLDSATYYILLAYLS